MSDRRLQDQTRGDGLLNGRSKTILCQRQPEVASRDQPCDQDTHAKCRRIDQKILQASMPCLQLDLRAFNECGECYGTEQHGPCFGPESESEQKAEQQESSEMFNIVLETGLGPFCGRYDRQYHQGQCKTNCAETNELS